MHYKIKVGITIGDPSGIGPAITLKAIKKLKGLAEFVVIGDSWVFKKVQSSHRSQAGSRQSREKFSPQSGVPTKSGKVMIL